MIRASVSEFPKVLWEHSNEGNSHPDLSARVKWWGSLNIETVEIV